MATVVQQPPMVITEPTRTIIQHTVSFQLNINIPVVRGLAITQIVIGALTFSLGIVEVKTMCYYLADDTGLPIAAGIWIIVTGLLGICSCNKNQNFRLHETHMVFCIMAAGGSFITGCRFAGDLRYYNNCDDFYWLFRKYYRIDCSNYVSLGRGLYATLLLLMILEFCISLVVSIYCFQASPTCCGKRTTGMILQQQQHQVVIKTTGQMPQQEPQQPYEMNKVDFTQQSQPMMSQQPMVNQGSVVMYPPETNITQGTYPSPNNTLSVYQENSQAVPQPYS